VLLLILLPFPLLSMKALKDNLKKLEGAHPSIRNAAIDFVEHAFSLGMTFTISEVLRTYERQTLLLSQGRTRSDIMKNVFPYGFRLNASQMKDMMKIYDEGREMKGSKVTFTLSSEHISGKAMDVYPIETTYSELSALAIKWGIRQPYAFEKIHFSLENARIPEPVMRINPLEKLKKLEQRLSRMTTDNGRSVISFVIKNLKKRLGL